MLATRTFLGLCLASLAVLLTPLAAQAATINVGPSATDEATSSDASCSLREAVIAANQDSNTVPANVSNCTAGSGPDTIQLGGNNVTLTLAGPNEDSNTTGDLDVLDDLTITSSTGTPQIDQSALDRVIAADAANLTLENLVVTGGELSAAFGNNGGNIRFAGGAADVLRLDNTDVTLGQANRNGQNGDGGGIFASGGSVVVENGSSVTANNANGGLASNFGGGIFVEGSGTDLTVSDSSVSSNQAGVDIFGGQGGGIYFAATGAGAGLTLDSATVSTNAVGGGTSANASQGGGVFVDNVVTGTVSILGTPASQINDNDAGGGSGNAAGEGGGLFVEGSLTSFSIAGAEVNGNEAGGRGGTGNGDGAGIHSNSTDMQITGSTIDDNVGGAAGSSSSSGAGIYSADAGVALTSSSVSRNHANGTAGQGGGIFLDITDGAMTITSSTIADNTAVNQGGGIYRTATPSIADSITSSTISGNTVAGGVNASGGGIYAETDHLFTITSSTISGNTADASTGGVPTDAGVGGGAFLGDRPAGASPGYSLENSTVSGNTATSATDNGIGGGIAVGGNLGNAFVNLNHSTINGNTAAVAGGTAGQGGNLHIRENGVFTAQIVMRASIVANGVGLAGFQNCGLEGNNADFASTDFNVESTTPSQCGLDQPDDAVGADPLLSGLALNGGTTQSHALGSGSPAIDRVTSGCPPPAVDQRGVARPQGTACDSGSFEFIPPPTVTGTTPATGSNDNQPEVTGTAALGSTVSLFTTSDCTGSPVATGSQTTFASPGITVTVADNTTTTFYASSTGGPGATGCSTTSATYQEVTPPAPPTLTSTNPASGANDNQPEVTGTAPAGTTVSIYANASCTGSPVATGSEATFAAPGITVTVADNSTTTFRATATNVNGTSACSATSVAYQEVTPPVVTPPDPTPPKKCKKGQKLKKGKCVKKRRKKKK